MRVQIFLEFLANGFIAKQVPVKSTFHPYCSAQQGASCCGRSGAWLYVTCQKESACIYVGETTRYPTIAAYRIRSNYSAIKSNYSQKMALRKLNVQSLVALSTAYTRRMQHIVGRA